MDLATPALVQNDFQSCVGLQNGLSLNLPAGQTNRHFISRGGRIAAERANSRQHPPARGIPSILPILNGARIDLQQIGELALRVPQPLADCPDFGVQADSRNFF